SLITDCAAVVANVSSSGTGAAGYLPLWMTTTNLGNSGVYQDAAGKIGIGTIAPQAPLQVGEYLSGTGEATNKGAIMIQDPTTATSLNGDTGLEFKASPATDGYGWKIGTVVPGAVDLAIGYRESSASWTEAMRINSAGNVGIGVTAPPKKFTVGNGSVGAGFGIGWNAIGGIGETDFYNYGQGGAGGFQFYNYASNGAVWPGGAATPLMTINSVGNVGIGTTLPLGTLHIHSATDANVLISDNTSFGPASGYIASVNDANSTVTPLEIAASKFYLSQGSVGIGTTNPAEKLDVSGNIRASGALIVPGTAGNSGGWYVCMDGSGRFNWGTSCSSSDARLKRDIREIPRALERVLHLQGATYFWKDAKRGAGRQLGLIAQDVEKFFPEAVIHNPDGLLALNYDALLAPVIEAVKALYGQVQGLLLHVSEQRERMSRIEEENLRLRAELTRQRTAICEIRPQAALCAP
ncbi:MAG TPA: tail fiber domain-containing protein, partial [Verrucomicrobiae bacterium]|nr:tail fiber domain-containing protein [Verrucomicrobiae bacterium]